MARIIGIDLGTTNTAVAVLDAGRPRVIEDERGYKVLPSVVSAKGEGRFVVGQAAASLVLTRPDRTVSAVKRLMGRRFDSPEVARVRERVHYEIREAPDGGVQVQVGDAWMTPPEVAAVILQVARSIAEKAIGERVEEAVITVPAHFNHAQRAATMEAAHLAGLRCERLLNEPTAAALAYGHRRTVDRTLVIFDLGGGTFDVSVLRLQNGIYEILSTAGDTFLGGEDFDYRVVDHLADQHRAKHGVDLKQDRAALQRLKDAAERAKCELSFSDRANVVVAHASPGKNLETILTRQRVEELTRDLVERCIAVARGAVGEANIGLSEVDEVILVGGQTRMPCVREAVAALFGRESSRTVHPEEAVAIGAAVHAHTLEDAEGPRPVLLDVTPFDLGIDSHGGMFSPIILKNARVPSSETKTFATVYDNQESVRITVRQGESRTASENEFLGEFVFDRLPPAPRLQTKVSVTFRIDNNGMLHVSAVDPSTGDKRNITIRNYAEHASEPKPPSADEAAIDRDTRARQVAAPPAPPPPPAGIKRKSGILDAILGFGARRAVKPPPAAPPVAPVENETPGIDLAGIDPAGIDRAGIDRAGIDLASIDLSNIVPTPGDALIPLDEEEEIESSRDEDVSPLEEDDLYGEAAGPAAFGLAGAADLGARHENPFGDDAGPALGMAELFGDADDFEMGDGDPVDPGAFDLGTLEPGTPEPGTPEPGTVDLSAEDDADPPTDSGRRVVAASGLLFEGMGGVLQPLDEDELVDLAASENLADMWGETEEVSVAAPLPAPLPAPVPAPVPHPVPVPQRATTLAPPAPYRATPVAPSWEEDILLPFSDDDMTRPVTRKAKKPAKIKLRYRERATFVTEYRQNLRQGGAFIKTDKPLAVGRECVFEVDAPGLSEALVFDAIVVSVTEDHAEPGMQVEYRLGEAERRQIELALQGD